MVTAAATLIHAVEDERTWGEIKQHTIILKKALRRYFMALGSLPEGWERARSTQQGQASKPS